ncbi:MAG: hypothetical protein JXX14_04165 [Deltaproteobacteria bacterium]|nr:hypothetical protein [Deltaproteobacteria bacterium]
MKIIFILSLIYSTGCWDDTEHELDDVNVAGSSETDDTSSDRPAGTDSALSGTGGDTASANHPEKRNSLLASDWAGFGAACSDVSQCTGYPAANPQCLQNVMGLVNCPGGYCTACCNQAGEGVCGQGIDCVGADNAYLICLERCETDADCRTEDHYICHEGLYYMESIFTGKYCLPDAGHITPDPGVVQNVTCPWPWI